MADLCRKIAFTAVAVVLLTALPVQAVSVRGVPAHLRMCTARDQAHYDEALAAIKAQHEPGAHECHGWDRITSTPCQTFTLTSALLAAIYAVLAGPDGQETDR